MSSTPYTAAPASFPANLVGPWKLAKDDRSSEIASHHAVSFRFDPNGDSMTLNPLGSTNGHGCTAVTNGSYGHATVAGSSFRRHVQTHTETTENTCNGTESRKI